LKNWWWLTFLGHPVNLLFTYLLTYATVCN